MAGIRDRDIKLREYKYAEADDSSFLKSTSLATNMTGFNIDEVREQFPALKQEQVYLDNAGGSQVLGTVIKS
jgi:hypothetical protein